MGIAKKKEMPKKHYCPEHDKMCTVVLVMPKRVVQLHCPEGCILSKRETVLKYPEGSRGMILP